MLRIGLISAHNPYDRNDFSGTAYYILRALSRLPDVEVEVIGKQFHQTRGWSHRAYRSLSNGRFASLAWAKDRLFKHFLALVERDLRQHGPHLDLLLAPVSSEIVASIRNPDDLPPIIFVTDATPQYIRETYPQPVEDIAFEHERVVLKRSAKIIYSSHFMAARAQQEFPDVLADRTDSIEVIPFGLNMDAVPPHGELKALDAPVELLFVGKEWLRKGGSIAIDMVESLRQKAVSARLTIIGCEPDMPVPHNVEVIPYLNKNIPEQQSRYIEILKRSHFLVLPTRGDCTPMVIAEANAFGIPAIVAEVGGVATLVDNGINGYLLPFSAQGTAYADIVLKLFMQPELYQPLTQTCRRRYEERLNWDAWSHRLIELASNLPHQKQMATTPTMATHNVGATIRVEAEEKEQ